MDSLRGVIDDLRLVQNGTNDNALLLSFVHAMQCSDASTPTISDVVHSERKNLPCLSRPNSCLTAPRLQAPF